MGLSTEEIDEKFGHLITAFRYGVPPHAGIAPGIDRLVMVLTGKEAIRDVIAFPKAQSGADPLTGAPAPVSDEQLRGSGPAVWPSNRRRRADVADLTQREIDAVEGARTSRTW